MSSPKLIVNGGSARESWQTAGELHCIIVNSSQDLGHSTKICPYLPFPSFATWPIPLALAARMLKVKYMGNWVNRKDQAPHLPNWWLILWYGSAASISYLWSIYPVPFRGLTSVGFLVSIASDEFDVSVRVQQGLRMQKRRVSFAFELNLVRSRTPRLVHDCKSFTR